MELLQLLREAFILIFPAYCANAIPVITGGGLPMDFGKKFWDEKPILGKNKTFRGFFSGLALGTAVGFAESVILSNHLFVDYPVTFGLFLSLGALLGDVATSFVKRRLGFKPGSLFPVIDQTSFIIGAILFSLPFLGNILSWQLTVTIFMVTPPIHLLTNFAAWKIGLKSDPW